MVKYTKVAAEAVFRVRRTMSLKSGGRIVVFMDLWKVSETQAGLFLGCYKLSWIAFDAENPDRRFLMDAHAPDGLHYHVDAESKAKLEFTSLEDALNFFDQKRREIFGDTEEDE